MAELIATVSASSVVLGGEVVLERACSAAADRADNDFRQLLLEQEERGEISTTGSWASAKPKPTEDARAMSMTNALSSDLLATSESSTEGFSDASMSLDAGGDLTLEVAAAMSPQDLAQLELLRMEQARLRNEYIKMEEKLRAMENRIRSGGSSPVAGSPAPKPAAPSAGSWPGDQPPAAGGEGVKGRASPVQDAEALAGAAVVNGAGAAAAVPAYDTADDGEQQPVVVKGGEGEVSVELDKEGVLVFRFAELERPRGAVSISVRSSKKATESEEEH
eukprot:gene3695-3955_t